MSWMQKLYDTYEANAGRPALAADTKPLLPVGHALQQAHIEVSLDARGNFLRAVAIEPTYTIIPATESSTVRTNTKTGLPHALSDKVQYVGGDYKQFGGAKNSYFDSYLEQLRAWCERNSNAMAVAVLKYVSKRCLVVDLVSAGVLHVDADNKLLTGWDQKSNLPKIFRTLTKKEGIQDQGDALVRWRVETPGQPLSGTWEDQSLADSWIDFVTAGATVRGLCLIGGVNTILAQKHPAKLRSGKDGAKLISSNDESGYTFRGRFLQAEQAATVGSEMTQKAHSALRWLIGRKQAHHNGSQVVVTWAISGKGIPDPLADSDTLFGGRPEEAGEEQPQATGDAGQAFAIRLSKLIAGYKAELGPTDDVVTMGLDSATPGRMAITFYRELKGSEFLERIDKWHSSFAWFQQFSWETTFVGVPAPKDIAEAAFGLRADDKIRRATVERLLPCIIDGRPLPRDLMDLAVRQVAHRIGMKSGKRKFGEHQIKDEWEWEKTLGIACSLFRGFHKERRYAMALQAERKTRDYLYGRLLAIAEHLEARALYMADETRDTTAARLMQRFADHPYSTWLNVEKGLQPYKSRLQTKSPAFLHWIASIFDEVHDMFEVKDYMDDRPLSGEYLLGYHCQRRALHAPRAAENSHDDQNDISNA
jgi:CRISPR-associated protein Csd1